ncbi:MAG: hypothetical protein EKK64_00455 [Neisseriaceae bacterium]|nr:MAG: hypothetical protein EKK64_00455 [Neisseriaceae bacterium]
MTNFKTFIESKEKEDVSKIIAKLPKNHQKLLNGYKFKYTGGNTLHGDNEHIGYIHKDNIVVAAPWHYSRSFTTLHEIAHLVYEKLFTEELKKEWSDLFKNTIKSQIEKNPNSKDSLKQNAEEIFCMAYAATYAKHPPSTYLNEKWQDFVKYLP